MSQVLQKIKNKVQNYKTIHLYKKEFNLNSNKKSVLTISFDDFPKTAWENSKKIFREHNIKATYYTSFKLINQKCEHGIMFTQKDIDEILNEGHEVACHTYSHYRMSNNKSEIISNFNYNAKVFKQITKSDQYLKNFSYPFGTITTTAKQICNEYFTSSRSVFQGINKATIDLSALKAMPLFGKDWLKNAKEVIDYSKNTSCWIIFFTHGIEEKPGDYDTLISDYILFIQYALKNCCNFLSTREAINYWGIK